MKHSLKIPQKKTKCLVSYLEKPLKLIINDIKIKNFIGINNIHCEIPIGSNEDTIDLLEIMDNIAYTTLLENPEWSNNQIIDNVYNYSYSSDLSTINLLFNDKTSCYMDGNNKQLEEILEILRDNTKLREININMEINFLGLFIYDNAIINKWIIKIINIEELDDNLNDWDREEIEDDWQHELVLYEETIMNKIELYKQSLNNAKKLLEDIKNEENYNNWEKKILKLKNYILKI
jgi:hypothetical protein